MREIRFACRLLVTAGAAVVARLGMVLCGVREMLGRFSVMLDRSARPHALASSEIHGGREHDTRRAFGVCTREQTSGCRGLYPCRRNGKDIPMLMTLIVVLVVLWLLGVGTSYTLGGFIHILLVVALIVVLLRVIQGRNPISG